MNVNLGSVLNAASVKFKEATSDSVDHNAPDNEAGGLLDEYLSRKTQVVRRMVSPEHKFLCIPDVNANLLQLPLNCYCPGFEFHFNDARNIAEANERVGVGRVV